MLTLLSRVISLSNITKLFFLCLCECVFVKCVVGFSFPNNSFNLALSQRQDAIQGQLLIGIQFEFRFFSCFPRINILICPTIYPKQAEKRSDGFMLLRLIVRTCASLKKKKNYTSYNTRRASDAQPAGGGCRIHRLHLGRRVRLAQRVSYIWHLTIWSSNFGECGVSFHSHRYHVHFRPVC